jgi:hypothetical protein
MKQPHFLTLAEDLKTLAHNLLGAPP